MGEEKTIKDEKINAIDFTKNLNEEHKKLFFVAVLKKSKYLVINYIYIEKELRGKGYGHIVFNKLKSIFTDYRGIIVEVDPSNSDDLMDITNRRLKYYKDLKFNILNCRYKILQTGTDKYQEMLLYIYNLNNPTNYIYTYKEIAEILKEYYKTVFDTDYERQYQLFNLKD